MKKKAEKLFSLNITLLKLLGMWYLDNVPSWQKILYNLYSHLINIFLVVYDITTTLSIYENRYDVPKAAANLDKSLVAYNTTFKLLFLLWNKQQFIELIEEIRVSDIVSEESNKRMNKLTNLVMMGGSFAVFTFIIYSLIFETTVYDTWTPLEPYEAYSLTYFAIFTFQIIILYPIIWRYLAIEAIIGVLMIYLVEQLQDVQEKLRALHADKYSIEELEIEFKQCVKKHTNIIRTAKKINNLFEHILFIHNTLVTFEICLSAFMITYHMKRGDVQGVLSFCVFIFVTMCNAYLYCSLGNELIMKSEGIAIAAYESQWVDWPVHLQKKLIDIIRCSQRPLFLSAGITVMSLETYTKIVTNGYRLFAILCDAVN